MGRREVLLRGGRRDVLMEAPRVVLRWGVLLPEALRVGLIVIRGVIEQGALSVGRNAFPGGRVEGLLSCS